VGVENAIPAKLQGWKMQEYVDSSGGKCRSGKSRWSR